MADSSTACYRCIIAVNLLDMAWHRLAERDLSSSQSAGADGIHCDGAREPAKGAPIGFGDEVTRGLHAFTRLRHTF
jgi:hypothetical protein